MPSLWDTPACKGNRYSCMIVTVSGPHGAGKSTYAVQLAKNLGLRHVSAGLLFRKLARERQVSLEEFGKIALKDPSIDRLVDDETMREAEKGEVVVDGQLAGWILKEIADLRIYLTASDKVRIERIAKRDHLEPDEAMKETLLRERVQSERYRLHYGFKVEDRSIYHLILDTSLLPMEDTARVLMTVALAVKNKVSDRSSRKP